MSKFLVIGNPIEHSLSPKLHNFWFKANNIQAIYEKKKLNKDEIHNFILDIKKNKIDGINVTVPFKKEVIQYLDDLSYEAKITQSVNTIYLKDRKITGHNTDIKGFELGIKHCKFDLLNKKIFILGAGGVVPSIIFALKKMNVESIIVSNRTKKKAEDLREIFNFIKIINWGEIPEFDMIINATSLGLNNSDEINLDLSKVGRNKLFFDIIYNPSETKFLKNAKKLGNKTENGKMMFIYQAYAAFKIWHGIEPEINDEVLNLFNK